MRFTTHREVNLNFRSSKASHAEFRTTDAKVSPVEQPHRCKASRHFTVAPMLQRFWCTDPIQSNSSCPACLKAQAASTPWERHKLPSKPSFCLETTESSGSLVRVAQRLRAVKELIHNSFKLWSPTIHTTPQLSSTREQSNGLLSSSQREEAQRSDFVRSPRQTPKNTTAKLAAAPNREAAVTGTTALSSLELNRTETVTNTDYTERGHRAVNY